MRMLNGFFCLIVLLLVGMSVYAQQAPAPANPPREAPKNEYTANAAELNLTADQLAKINEKTQAMQTALGNWDKEHKDQFTKLAADMKANEKDPATLAKLNEQMQALRAERTKLEVSLQKEIFDILTPDQKIILAGIRAYTGRDYPTMVKVLGLSADQEAKLKTTVKTNGSALAKWDQDNNDKIHQLEKQLQDAQTALQALRAERTKLSQDQFAAIMAILTPEQHLAWRSYRFQQDMIGRFNRAKLTDDQTAKIKVLCDQTAKDTLALPPTDSKGVTQAYEKLIQTIHDQVLTDDQRAAIAPKTDKR